MTHAAGRTDRPSRVCPDRLGRSGWRRLRMRTAFTRAWLQATCPDPPGVSAETSARPPSVLRLCSGLHMWGWRRADMRARVRSG